MPLAPAHPAAVLPLQRLGLPLSALVAGAVAPDVPVYLPAPVAYSTTHSGGGLVVDVLLGLLLLWLWDVLLRDAVVDLLPFLRQRRPFHLRLDRRAWLLAPLAVAVGAATHVLWDSMTHDWGFVVEELSVLREEHGSLPLYSWLQHVSTAVGTFVVAAYCLQRLRSQSLLPRPAAVRRTGAWVAVVPLAALAAGASTQDPVRAVGVALVSLVAVSIGWRTGRRRVPA